MHKTYEQLIRFDVILWLLRLYCGRMFNACGNHTMNEFSIRLCCQIIAKWLSFFSKCHITLLFALCTLNSRSFV